MKMSRKLREQVFNVLYMEHLRILETVPVLPWHESYKVGLCLSIFRACREHSFHELSQEVREEVGECIRMSMRPTGYSFVTEVFAGICYRERYRYAYSLNQEVMTALVPIRWMWFWNWVETGELPEPSQFFRDLIATPEGKELVDGLLNELTYPRVA
mgnify:CR=1 FL=1